MEKALHGAHGIGYETYRHHHHARMDVEKRREAEYAKSRAAILNITGNLVHQP
jgi:hypothetical protein